jgi:hypothetical protein
MIKGVLIALGIIVVSAIIPIVHFVALPASPFIGGYFGINHAHPNRETYATQGLMFGSLLGLVVLVVFGTAAGVGMLVAGMLERELSQRVMVVMWLGVGVFTLYTGSLGTLGAMYSVLRSEEKNAGSQEEASDGGSDTAPA